MLVFGRINLFLHVTSRNSEKNFVHCMSLAACINKRLRGDHYNLFIIFSNKLVKEILPWSRKCYIGQ